MHSICQSEQHSGWEFEDGNLWRVHGEPFLFFRCAFSCTDNPKAKVASVLDFFWYLAGYSKRSSEASAHFFLWECKSQNYERACGMYIIYSNIRDGKTLHRDWSAIGSRLRQTCVVLVWEFTIVGGEFNHMAWYVVVRLVFGFVWKLCSTVIADREEKWEQQSSKSGMADQFNFQKRRWNPRLASAWSAIVQPTWVGPGSCHVSTVICTVAILWQRVFGLPKSIDSCWYILSKMVKKKLLKIWLVNSSCNLERKRTESWSVGTVT